jgi:antitoxin component YwqK of YwqJK toxin-antitoxin module
MYRNTLIMLLASATMAVAQGSDKGKTVYTEQTDGTVKMVRMHENGQVVEEGTYLNGRPEGRWQTWDADGNKTAEINYHSGRRHGEFRSYDRNNGTVIELAYSNGQLMTTDRWRKDANYASTSTVK